MVQLRAESEAVVEVETNGASPKRDVLVHQNISSAFGCKFICANGKSVSAPAERVSEKKYVGVSFRRNRDGAEIIDADLDDRGGGQRE